MDQENIQHTIKIIATFTTLIPIGAGVLRYKTAGTIFRLFLLFLVYGFLTDFFVWQLMEVSRPASFFLFIVFSLAEALFLLWFVKVINATPVITKICNILSVCMIPFWICAHYVFHNSEQYSALFDTSYLIIISILSAYTLLKLAEEKSDLQKLPVFWFMLGIFFYCFTTFFLSGFLESALLQKIWFIHNLINLMVYIVFTIGFLTISKSSPATK